MGNLPDRDCVVCHKTFTPIRVNNVICPDIRCKYKRHREQIVQWAKDNYVHIEKENFECPYCHKIIIQNRYDQKTCGKQKCMGKHEYQLKKKRERGIYDERYMGQI